MASAECCSKAFNGGLSLNFFSSPIAKAHLPIHLLPFPYAKICNSLKLKSPSLGISQRKRTPSVHLFRSPIVSCLPEDESGVYLESGDSSSSSDSPKSASVDIKLPRRSLLVTFTCNGCGARSQKFINRLAYERGTVFVQCSGCFQHHKLVDNLGLVVEYDFREEISDPNANQE